MSKKATGEAFFKKLLAAADIRINGHRAWDLKVNDNTLYQLIMADGTLAFGEAYMAGLWDCQDIAELINRLLRINADRVITDYGKMQFILNLGKEKFKKIANLQSILRAKQDVSYHYDLGNKLYAAMLDKRMTYSCAYWDGCCNLDEAQEAKLDLLCRKLGLKPGMKVLDIGCGWGSFMLYAAEKYDVICDGLTLSKAQASLGKRKAEAAGLPVHFFIQDYREYQPKKPYERIISVGMLEHVGQKNYTDYFAVAHRLLSDNGMFLVHTIGSPFSAQKTDPWINKYIFPNGVIPSLEQIGAAIDGLYNIEDLHNIGPDYDKTLCSWHDNFRRHWPILKCQYDEQFYRMWTFYLLSCAGAFRSRQLNVWQFSLTKVGANKPHTVRAS